MQQARAVARLKAEKGYRSQQVARELGVEASTITKAEALLSLPEDIQSLVDEGAVTPSTAYAISLWPDIHAQRRLAQAVAAGEMSRDAVIEAVHAAIGMKRTPPHASRLVCRDRSGLSVTVKANRPLDWDSLIAALIRVTDKARRFRDSRKEIEDLGHPRRQPVPRVASEEAEPPADPATYRRRRSVGDDLPDERLHWLPVSRSRGCMAVNLDTTPACQAMLQAACERLAAQPGREWHLPEDREHGQPAGICRTADMIAAHSRCAGEPPRLYFDPRMAPFLRDEMGLPPALPRYRRHWVSATMEGCSRVRIERTRRHNLALLKLCARLLADSDAAWELPQGEGDLEPPGVYRPADVIRIYSHFGKRPLYYFDPRLIDAGIITRQAVRSLAAEMTPAELEAPDPALQAEEAKMLRPPPRPTPTRKRAARRKGR
jgi:hypothetical protein